MLHDYILISLWCPSSKNAPAGMIFQEKQTYFEINDLENRNSIPVDLIEMHIPTVKLNTLKINGIVLRIYARKTEYCKWKKHH